MIILDMFIRADQIEIINLVDGTLHVYLTSGREGEFSNVSVRTANRIIREIEAWAMSHGN